MGTCSSTGRPSNMVHVKSGQRIFCMLWERIGADYPIICRKDIRDSITHSKSDSKSQSKADRMAHFMYDWHENLISLGRLYHLDLNAIFGSNFHMQYFTLQSILTCMLQRRPLSITLRGNLKRYEQRVSFRHVVLGSMVTCMARLPEFDYDKDISAICVTFDACLRW